MKKHTILIAMSLLVGLGALGYLTWRFLPVAPLAELPGQGVENTVPKEVTVETVADNLNLPWSLNFLPNGDLLFSERDGLIKRLDLEGNAITTIGELPVSAVGEGGFLGITLHPGFTENNFIYMYYTYESNDNLFNKVVRSELTGNELANQTDILAEIPASSIHNGGRLAFGPDGLLYITAGDASEENLAQNLDSLAGKILRINPDGSIPADNPFADSPVYSYGHRNPQGLAWSGGGTLYATEHGPKGHDEVNVIEPGRNYGWPEVRGRIELGANADAPVENYMNPFIESGVNTWAPSGTAFYTGTTLPESFQNTLIYSGLRSKALWRLDPVNSELEKLYEDKYGRLRDVAVGPNGDIYFSTSNRDGRGIPAENDDRILRITLE